MDVQFFSIKTKKVNWALSITFGVSAKLEKNCMILKKKWWGSQNIQSKMVVYCFQFWSYLGCHENENSWECMMYGWRMDGWCVWHWSVRTKWIIIATLKHSSNTGSGWGDAVNKLIPVLPQRIFHLVYDILDHLNLF